jgi:hypothetical protein
LPEEDFFSVTNHSVRFGPTEQELFRSQARSAHLRTAKDNMMNLSIGQLQEVAAELRQFATDLNLSDDQRERLKTVWTEGRAQLNQYKQENPKVTGDQLLAKIAVIRSSLRQQVVSFLTPDQLAKWDDAVAKAKDFLIQKAASA